MRLSPKAAMAMPMMEKFMTFVWPEFKTSAKKDRIAKYAATLIEPGDWIFLDNGTTVGQHYLISPHRF